MNLTLNREELHILRYSLLRQRKDFTNRISKIAKGKSLLEQKNNKTIQELTAGKNRIIDIQIQIIKKTSN